MNSYSIPPIINDGFLYMNGFAVSNDATTPNTVIDVGAGQCRDTTNNYDIILSSALTINGAVNGINALDTGTLAASSFYYIYVIFDPLNANPTGCILSLSKTSPLLPFGYGAFRIIGFVSTDSSSHFLKFYVSGDNVNRLFMYDAPQATSVTAGNATTFTAVNLSTLVPSFDSIPVIIGSSYTPNAASHTLSMQPQGGTGSPVTITGQVSSVILTTNSTLISKLSPTAPEIAYKVSNSADAVALNVVGFYYYV